jgi:tRNA G37 N-methylase TrmD
MPILLMSPGGTLLTAEISEKLSIDSENYCIICGHYE